MIGILAHTVGAPQRLEVVLLQPGDLVDLAPNPAGEGDYHVVTCVQVCPIDSHPATCLAVGLGTPGHVLEHEHDPVGCAAAAMHRPAGVMVITCQSRRGTR